MERDKRLLKQEMRAFNDEMCNEMIAEYGDKQLISVFDTTGYGFSEFR